MSVQSLMFRVWALGYRVEVVMLASHSIETPVSPFPIDISPFRGSPGTIMPKMKVRPFI